jgi:hypothetical protein
MKTGSKPAARLLHLLAWVAAAVVGLALFVAMGAPLAVRGAVLAHLVEHLSQDLCGSVRLDGGHFSLGVVPALLFQRPFEVVFDNVRILEPEGLVFFRARAVRVRMTVLRRPWDVAVDEVTLSDGAWALVNKRPGEPITVAFTKVPPTGRSECRAPTPPPARPPRQGEVLEARRVIVRNVSVVLSFPDWGAILDSADARGSLKVRVAGDELQFLFDVRDLVAKRGGALRIGPAGGPLTPEVPFDDVAIGRIAVTEEAPQNILLEVRRARTADATLSGRALFTDALVPAPRRVPAGMKLDAEWRGVGEALARDPTWAPLGARLARLDSVLHASLRGPFVALSGSAALVGRGAALEGKLLPQRRYELSVQFRDLDTNPLVAPSWREQLGGRLNGRIFVKAQVGRKPRSASMSASMSVDTLELDLRRTGPGVDARRVVVGRSVRASSSADLQIGIGRLALERRVLRVAPLRARGRGIDLTVNLSAEREASSGAFLFQAASAPDSRVVIRGETFRLPPLLRARLDAEHEITIEPASVSRLGGGAIDVGGAVRSGGRTDLRVAVRDYPLARIPGLAGVHVPGPGTSVGQLLQGQVNASFDVTGPTRRPCLSGQLGLTGVSWAGRRLGDGRIVFRCLPDGARYEGTLIGALKIRGELRRRPEHGAKASTTGDLAISGPGIDVNAALRLGATGALDGTLSALVDGRGLGSSRMGVTGSGAARAVATVSGSVAAPHVKAAVRFDAFTVSWPSSPLGAVRVEGPLQIDDRSFLVGPLLVNLGAGGWLQIGGAKGPGRLRLASATAPVPVKNVDLTVRGGGLTTGRPIAGVGLRDLAVGLRLADAGPRDLLLTGDVFLGHDSYDVRKRNKAPAGARPTPIAERPTPHAEALDHIWIDVRVSGPKDAVEVRVPHVPDLPVGLRCKIEGPLSSLRLSGELKGNSLYSRLVLRAADWFSDRDLSKCDIGPH